MWRLETLSLEGTPRACLLRCVIGAYAARLLPFRTSCFNPLLLALFLLTQHIYLSTGLAVELKDNFSAFDLLSSFPNLRISLTGAPLVPERGLLRQLYPSWMSDISASGSHQYPTIESNFLYASLRTSDKASVHRSVAQCSFRSCPVAVAAPSLKDVKEGMRRRGFRSS